MCFFNIETYEIKRKFSIFGYDGLRKEFYWLNSIKKLKLNFFDIDKIIEDNQQMKITKIFETKGEDFFRKIEKNETLNIKK